ncbi:MAG: dihydroxyacetone kinase subunit L [Bryobacterales bacterium]|nr:dihydroxyacetone kinase subunit L [Bryobacterales bacterium]
MSSSMPRVEFVVRTMAETVLRNEEYFGQLDAVVGDGDFGYSLARGFEIVLNDFDTFDRSSIAAFLRKIGMVIASRVGGTSGPLWGTAFLRAAAAAGDKTALEPEDAVAMLRAAAAGIQQRGGASLGEKTLLDALVPAIDRLEAEIAAGAAPVELARKAAETARQAAEATSALMARRGRASYTGERSIGSPDAGAVAVGVLAQAIADRWSGAVGG